MKTLGNHILVEMYGCNRDTLNDAKTIESEMVKAAELINARVVNSSAHNFSPQGVSAVVIIAESHLTMHTWPEYGYAAVDLFICTGTLEPMIAFEHLKNALQATHTSTIELKRGQLNDMEKLKSKPV
jgi:S-adenosylmethionine decarboxylase proenzyme